jgi:CRISPR-associated protein Cas5t
MKALKVKLYQETAVYRNPVTMEVIESFPLPPPSTILGFLHNLVKARETIPGIESSIQGTYSSMMRDYQWYKKHEKGKATVINYPIVVNALNGVRLTIHIKAGDSVLEKLYDALLSPPYFMHLGRAEDIVKFEGARIVQLEPKEAQEIKTPAYIPLDVAKRLGLTGILYRLPTYYSFKEIAIGKETKKVREFEWKDYYYVESGELEEGTKHLQDEEGDLVWW